jgi:hypothetical protein
VDYVAPASAAAWAGGGAARRSPRKEMARFLGPSTTAGTPTQRAGEPALPRFSPTRVWRDGGPGGDDRRECASRGRDGAVKGQRPGPEPSPPRSGAATAVVGEGVGGRDGGRLRSADSEPGAPREAGIRHGGQTSEMRVTHARVEERSDESREQCHGTAGSRPSPCGCRLGSRVVPLVAGRWRLVALGAGAQVSAGARCRPWGVFVRRCRVTGGRFCPLVG